MRLLITRLVRVLPMRCLEVSAIEANKRFPTVLDVRSETVTKPTEQMLNAMRDAEVGDNVFRDDPTVIRITVRECCMAPIYVRLRQTLDHLSKHVCIAPH